MSNSRNFNSEIRMCTSTYYNGREIFCNPPQKVVYSIKQKTFSIEELSQCSVLKL